MMRKTTDFERSARRLGAAMLLLAGAATLSVTGAAAQTTPGRAPGSQSGKTDPACASFGPGFARLPGSSTCVKISGGVQTDVYSTDISGTTRVETGAKNK